MATHQAALIPSKGQPFIIDTRPTPQPGPNEVVISVAAIAMNPVDYFQRDMGFLIANYPAIIGCDVAGTIDAVGSSVSTPGFKKGARVLAFASSFYHQGEPNANDYAAFQAKALVPVDFSTHFDAADKKGVLVWGAASSIGVSAVQTAAKALGFTVYVTASPKNFEYLKSLGVAKCFDYKDPEVVSKIVDTAKADGITLKTIFRAAGDRGGSDLQAQVDVVSAFGGGSIASAVGPLTPENTPQAEGVDIKFIVGPSDPQDRAKQMTTVFHEWLTSRLASGEFVPGPNARVVGKGLGDLNKALDILKGGVSAEKLVVEL
ncbi:hypothetical protein LTR20_009799 [Exophiala xenobiotica]|nr:hypothetical protein LTR40_009651 [Exophiala xenobiotica]KAK5379137.1 hypothetical protein LTS13_004029 [Exophiala xenobiotica]KAK5392014.1 hypothetical protein LTR79_010812 [Exophiala xenobiotica]KAK5411600.1 hypothetical protein LTR90_007974 [Exophiala xenobiotica]KAK5455413.1 hypothetical protein LTR20_009799 [Exophiala xenobiotica]